MIKEAAGYGVFSNVNINLLIASAGQGFGVVVDNKTGKQTYMKMAQLGVGLGLGAKDFRAVIIFNNPKTMDSFIDSGWEFGAHADAAAKAEDKGGATSGAVSAKDMTIYQITKAGLALQATVAGTKYWKDDTLN
jgi:lipid-binding SYLF domain-containing protein